MLFMMFFLLIAGAGAFLYFRKKPVDANVDIGAGGPGAGGELGFSYQPGGASRFGDYDVNYYDINYFDRDRYDRDRDYRDWWDNQRGRDRDDDDDHPWWMFWKGWNDDGRKTSDNSYRYYWMRFGDELRNLGMDDDDIDEFVRWVTKRNRSESEIRRYINEHT